MNAKQRGDRANGWLFVIGVIALAAWAAVPHLSWLWSYTFYADISRQYDMAQIHGLCHTAGAIGMQLPASTAQLCVHTSTDYDTLGIAFWGALILIAVAVVRSTRRGRRSQQDSRPEKPDTTTTMV